MAKACLPDDIYGPRQQTIFLGSSVQSVSCSVGWNEQQSSLTVVLVDDFCEVPATKPAKVYYPRPGSRVETRAADPGFTKPTIGVPVYFRIGGELGNSSDIFEFAGIIQSWTEDRSSGGYPVYTVQIVDPRLILQNLEVIVSDYAGAVGDVYNLINAYGWLESKGYACPPTLVNGATFGSPAGGFCGAGNNNEGTPWNKPSGPGGLRYAIQRLLSGSSHASFSPYGYASYRGPTSTDAAANGEFYGVIEGSSEDRNDAALAASGGHRQVSQYYIDLSEIPFTPTFYRIPGPSISLLDLITQVCNDSGSDYYIELLITPTKQKVIKVRTVQRAVQPTLGQIEDFVNTVENVTSKNIGRELRNEPSQAFVYGGYVQTIYQQDRTPTKSAGEIVQFWGWDAAHNLAYATNTTLTGRELGEWKVWLDIRPLNLVLTNVITGQSIPGLGARGANYIPIHEREMRMALSSFDSWMNYALVYNTGAGTEFGKYLKDTLGIVGPQIHFGHAGKPQAEIEAKFQNLLGFNLAFQPDQDPQNAKNADMRKIHEFIENWADTYYGKKFLVQLPYVCYCTDPDSGQVLYSDNPTNDGGWPTKGVTNILGLPVDATEGIPGDACSHFTDDVNKVLPFARFYNNESGSMRTEGDSLVYNPGDAGGNSLYVSSTVEEKPLEYYSYATAIVNLDNPVTMSGLEKDLSDVDQSFGGLIELAFESGLVGSDITNLKYGLSFNPDNSRGTDGGLGMALRRRTPSEAAVPMKSNTIRYGPKAYKGPPGQIHFVADDGLVPWEYDGYTSLMAGGINAMDEHAKSAVTYMQEGERGSVNFPGHPTKRLGSELNSSQSVMGLLTMQSADFKVLSQTFQFNRINIGPWEGSFGPSITNIQINIGDNGFTSNYTLSTFSPTFGRFAKYNANRLKTLGRQRQSFRKAQRERNKLTRALKTTQDRTARSLKNSQIKRSSKSDSVNSNTIKVGQMGEGNKTDGNTTVASNITDTSPRTLRMGNSSDWVNQGLSSNDAFYRPVWNGVSPSSRLPQYTKTAKGRAHKPDLCWEERPNQTRHVNPPFNGDGSGPSPSPYKPCIIDIDYLDPYSYPSKAKHDEDSNLAGNYADIGILGHGALPVGPLDMNTYVDEGNSFPEHLRMIASKGPMLMHGWGYDIDGKPIPNEADTESAASGGVFEAAGLKDRFLTHYLRKPHTWPVGPIDLRFDRARGVWTQPIQYKIVQASTTGGSIAAGESRADVQVLDMGTAANPVYDANGAVISNSSGTIKVTNPSWGDTIPSGDGFFAVYDSMACTYYPLVGGGSGGETTFYNTGVCYESAGEGCQAPSSRGCWTSSTIVVGSGLQASQISVSGGNSDCDSFPSGSGTFLSLRVPVYDVASTGDAGSTSMSVIKKLESNCISDWSTLIFGSGITAYTGGRSDQTGPIQDCNFVYIEASGGGGSGTKVSDSGYCGYTTSAITCSGVTCIEYGSGLRINNIDDGIARIQADHYISSTGATCNATESDIDKEFFSHLSFTSGIGVKDMGDCKYEIYACGSGGSGTMVSKEYMPCDGGYYYGHPKVNFTELTFSTGIDIEQSGSSSNYLVSSSHRISDSGSCGDEPYTYRGVPKYPKSTKYEDLVFGKGLRLTGLHPDAARPNQECHSYLLNSYQTIEDLASHNHASPDCHRPGVTDVKEFESLQLGTGLSLQEVSDGCTYMINWETQLPMTYTKKCGAPNGFTSGNPKNVVIGSGLWLEDHLPGSCSPRLNSYLEIAQGTAGNCVETFMTSPKPFYKLTVGSGLSVMSGAPSDICNYTINASPSLTYAATATCSQGSTVSDTSFNRILFASGLKVEGTTPAHGENCTGVMVNVDLRVAQGAGSNDCVDRFLGGDTPRFSKITAGSGLSFFENTENCSYTLNAANNISYTDETKCGQDGIGSSTHFTHINFGTGLGIEVDPNGFDPCEVTLNTLMSVKGGMTGCKPGSVDSVPTYSGFTKLHFGDGTKLAQNTAGCEYTVTVPQPTIDTHVFDNITLGTGLQLRPPVVGEYCDFTLDTTHTIKGGMPECKPDGNEQVADHTAFEKIVISDGLKLAMGGATATITAPQPTIGGNIFDSLAVGSGLELQTIDADACDYKLNSKLKFLDCDDVQQGSDRIEQVKVSAGLGLAGSSNNVTITLDKTACSGSPTLVPYVTDIVCVGSGLSVVERKMRFTPEGLFIDTVS